MIQWKNIMETGKTISRMDLVYIFGLNKKEKENYLETDTKVNGKTAKGMGMAHFSMPMAPNMKANGRTI